MDKYPGRPDTVKNQLKLFFTEQNVRYFFLLKFHQKRTNFETLQ